VIDLMMMERFWRKYLHQLPGNETRFSEEITLIKR